MLNDFIASYGAEDERTEEYDAPAPAAGGGARTPREPRAPREPREESSSGLAVWLENVRPALPCLALPCPVPRVVGAAPWRVLA